MNTFSWVQVPIRKIWKRWCQSKIFKGDFNYEMTPLNMQAGRPKDDSGTQQWHQQCSSPSLCPQREAGGFWNQERGPVNVRQGTQQLRGPQGGSQASLSSLPLVPCPGFPTTKPNEKPGDKGTPCRCPHGTASGADRRVEKGGKTWRGRGRDLAANGCVC